MTGTPTIYIILLVVSTVACASPKIGYDYDPTTDFTAYRTYAWVPGSQETTGDRRVDNTLVDRRIRTAIAAQLHSKGFTTSGDQRPDFYVAYHVGVKDMMKGSSTQRYIGDFAHGTHTTISDIQPYREGGLLVDIVDAATSQLVWRGAGVAEVDPGLSPEERNTRINEIVHTMLSHFPPK